MSQNPYIILITIFLLACKNNKTSLIDNNDSSRINKTIIEQPSRQAEIVIGIIYDKMGVRIFGDTSIEKDKIYYTSQKFEPYISFSDYNVKLDLTKKSNLNFKSNKDSYEYRTIIREDYSKAERPNFAGHYTLIKFGCGAPCQGAFLIDRLTGGIYDVPMSSLGYEFRMDSKLLVLNPADTSGFFDNCSYCKPEIYLFDERTKEFKQKNPKLE